MVEVQRSERPRSGYTALATKETDVADIEDEQLAVEISSVPRGLSKTFLYLSLVNVTLFLLTASMFLWLLNERRQPPQEKLLNAELRATSSYSPIFDMIDLEPSIRKLNGSVFPSDNPSIARQFPNPAADAIWKEDIELIRPIPITREQVLQLGKNPETVAKFDNEVWGLGNDAYVAALDVYHDLHCLNALRQAVYGNYYNVTPADATAEENLHEIHLNHCIDMLYQHISCSNNVNLVTRHWKDGLTYPSPDFSINKQCINFEKLRQWHKEHSVDMKKWMQVMKKPAGAKQEPKETYSSPKSNEDMHHVP